MKHLFIINPIAGGKNCRFDEVLQEVTEFTKTLDDESEIYVTKAPLDACKKIEIEAENADKLFVYACGGDGTLNECANAAANRTNVAITHYPCGTGNDFLKTFGIENTAKFRDLQALAAGEVRPIDLIECNDRYGINICSVGIDARIGTDVHKYSKLPIIGGATGYVVSLVVNVTKGVAQKFKITANGETLDKNITLACACNGRYYGGGFNPVPEAEPDDGLLDCLIVEPVSRLQVAAVVGKYAKGKFKELPDIIRHLRTTELQIEADRKFVVNIDGEAEYTNKMRFKVIRNGVNFIFPSKMTKIKAKA